VLGSDEQFVFHSAAFKITSMLAVRCQGALYVNRMSNLVCKVFNPACRTAFRNIEDAFFRHRSRNDRRGRIFRSGDKVCDASAKTTADMLAAPHH
jgi:hypothetical protein